MKTNLLLTIVGIGYGVLLMSTLFVKTRFTDTFRIDALFIPNPSETTRPLSFVAGLCFAGYSVYSLLAV